MRGGNGSLVSRPFLIQIDPPACDELSRVEANLNPGPDRPPVRLAADLGLKLSTVIIRLH